MFTTDNQLRNLVNSVHCAMLWHYKIVIGHFQLWSWSSMNDELSTASTALLRGRNNNATKCVLFFGGNR